MTIWKYEFEVQDKFEVMMPTDAKVLSVQMQGPQSCMWAQVEESQPATARQFRVFGTGHSMTYEDMRYIGTLQMHGGMLVFHLCEVEGGPNL